MSSEAGLRLSQVSHAYGDFVAAQDVNLVVQPGGVHCLLGPSGSGKSTLLRLVAGLEVVQEGQIDVAGQAVAGPRLHVPPESRPIGFVFQDYALFPHLDVRRNVTFGMTRGSEPEKRAAADELLARVDMVAYAAAMPHTLSGGQQQRVALARALAREPAVMLLDEPFSGLDAQLREEVRQTTLSVLQGAGVATLMVTHDPRESLVAGDMISVIRGGRILQTGSPAEVYERSVCRAVAEVFGAVNTLRGEVRGGRVETPLGALATELADGRPVEVLVRPESLRLSDHRTDGAVEATVRRRVPEGGTVQVALALGDGLEIEARDLARHGWGEGDRVFVALVEGAPMIHPID